MFLFALFGATHTHASTEFDTPAEGTQRTQSTQTGVTCAALTQPEKPTLPSRAAFSKIKILDKNHFPLWGKISITQNSIFFFIDGNEPIFLGTVDPNGIIQLAPKIILEPGALVLQNVQGTWMATILKNRAQ